MDKIEKLEVYLNKIIGESLKEAFQVKDSFPIDMPLGEQVLEEVYSPQSILRAYAVALSTKLSDLEVDELYAWAVSPLPDKIKEIIEATTNEVQADLIKKASKSFLRAVLQEAFSEPKTSKTGMSN